MSPEVRKDGKSERWSVISAFGLNNYFCNHERSYIHFLDHICNTAYCFFGLADEAGQAQRQNRYRCFGGAGAWRYCLYVLEENVRPLCAAV